MTSKSLLVPIRLKSFLIAIIVFFPSVSLFPSTSMCQDIGGIINSVMRLQQQQQYSNGRQNQHYNGRQNQRRRHSEEGDASKQKSEINRKKENDNRMKAEELQTQAQAAKDLIEDASSFVKENPSHLKLIEFVEKINELDAALIQGEPSKLKQLMENLSAALRREPAYEELEAARIEKRQQEADLYLPELIKTAKQQQLFIRSYITSNPTARPTAKFIPLMKELDAELAKPVLSKLKILTSKVDVSIRAASLTDDFVRLKSTLTDQSLAK